MEEVNEVVELATNRTGNQNLLIILVITLVAIVFIIENWQKLRSFLGIKNGIQLHEEEQARQITDLKNKINTIETELNDLKAYSKEAKKSRLAFENDTTATLREIRDDMIKSRVDTLRNRILEFGSSCKIKDYTKENFDYVLKSADEYHDLLNRYNMTNSQTDMAMGYIKKKYADYLEKGFPKYEQ